MSGVIVTAFLVLIVIVAVARSLVMVPVGQAFVVERAGTFRTVLHQGPHFVLLFLDKVRGRFDLGPQILSLPPQALRASDGTEVQATAVVHFRVIDVRAASYEVANPVIAVEQLTITALRQETGLLTADHAIGSTEDLHRSVWTVLHDTTPRWGVETVELELSVSPAAAPETPSSAQEWY
jgi:regulator of protease activity HflC (stomatin/prohibitin superfamily)